MTDQLVFTNETLAQIFGLAITALIPFVYLCKSRNKFYTLHIIIAFFRFLQYGLIGAYTGAISGMCSVFKNSVYLRYNIKNRKAPVGFMLAFILISLCVSLLGFNGYISVLPMAVIIFTGYGNWQHNYLVMCLCNIIGLILNVIYSIIVGAYGILPAYCIEFVAILVGVFRHNRILNESDDD